MVTSKLNWHEAKKEEKINLINKVMRESVSFSHAAEEWTEGATRNSLIGFYHRNRKDIAPRAVPLKRKPRQKILFSSNFPVEDAGYEPLPIDKPLKARKIPVPKRGTVEEPEMKGVSLLDRRRDQCAWISGEAKTVNPLMCGEPVHGERSYCAYHCSLSYVPPDRRSRQPIRTESGRAHSVRVR